MNNTSINNLLINGIRTPVLSCAPNECDHEAAVLFLHGNPGSFKDWQRFVPQVGEFSRVVAPDMPGYGSAERPKKFNYTVDGYAEHLHALIVELGIKKVHLVLHDFGGPWGLQFACNHPELVKSLTCVNTGPAPDYVWHDFAQIWRKPIIGEIFQFLSTHWSLRFFLNRDNPKPLPLEFTKLMVKDIDWGLSRGMLKLYRATDLAVLTKKLERQLKQLNVPALTLWGEGDKYVPVKHAQAQKEFFNAEIHTMPNCGHWPMIDDPELFESLLIPFLKKQVGAEQAN